MKFIFFALDIYNILLILYIHAKPLTFGQMLLIVTTSKQVSQTKRPRTFSTYQTPLGTK